MRDIVYPIIIAIVFLSGCSSKDVEPKERMYILSINEDSKSKIAPSSNKSIKVSSPIYGKELSNESMLYMKDGELNRYAYSKWADSPAGMFEKILVKSVENSNIFTGVINSESLAKSDFLLESEIINFYQNFTDNESYAILEIKINLISSHDNKLISSNRFNLKEECDENSAQGGVKAYGKIVKQLSSELKLFLATFGK